jgi:hypothetical protein
MKIHIPLLLALSALMLPARAQETEKAQSYQDVMRAQYAARQAPVPMGPAEAQKIYDTYLQSIGRPAREQSDESQNSNPTTSH